MQCKMWDRMAASGNNTDSIKSTSKSFTQFPFQVKHQRSQYIKKKKRKKKKLRALLQIKMSVSLSEKCYHMMKVFSNTRLFFFSTRTLHKELAEDKTDRPQWNTKTFFNFDRTKYSTFGPLHKAVHSLLMLGRKHQWLDLSLKAKTHTYFVNACIFWGNSPQSVIVTARASVQDCFFS